MDRHVEQSGCCAPARVPREPGVSAPAADPVTRASNPDRADTGWMDLPGGEFLMGTDDPAGFRGRRRGAGSRVTSTPSESTRTQ